MTAEAEKAAFLGGLVVTLKEQMHTDVLVKPGDEGPPIPTHKAVLVTSFYLFFEVITVIFNCLCFCFCAGRKIKGVQEHARF